MRWSSSSRSRWSTALSASLYGPANPSGMFNFVSKRPTDYALREVTRSYNSDSIGTGKVDLGGRIDSSGIFSYRLNALYGSGDAYVDHSHQRRALGDLGHRHPPLGARRAGAELQRLLAHRQGLSGLVHLRREDLAAAGAGSDARRLRPVVRRASTADAHWRVRASSRTSARTGTWCAGVLNQDASRNINTPVNNLTVQRRRLHLFVRQRLCAALRHHQRHRLSER